MSSRFLERLEQGPLVFDGGFGTMLYDSGVFISHCFDELNLSNPSLVRDVHRAYVEAGADVIETNTFGANRVKLAAHGCAERLDEIVSSGVRIAREAAGPEVLVAGSIGPLGIKIEPWGPTSVDEARELFREQAVGMRDTGVDLFVLETFADINEIQQALNAVREVAPELPVVAQMTLGEDGNSLYGTVPEVFARRLVEWGADVVGINCSVGPAIMLDTLERMAAVSQHPLSAQPNAGMPRNIDGRAIYLCSPEYMASYARRFLMAGARIVGGCCGTTPEHIRAIKRAARSSLPQLERERPALRVEAPLSAPSVPRRDKSRLASDLVEGRFVSMVELQPPRGIEADQVLAAARKLSDAGVSVVNIPDAPYASARMSCQALALLLEREVGIETVVHYCCRDRNLLGMQGDLLGIHALGLRNLLCTTGEPPVLGQYPDATAVFDVDAIGLVNMVHKLNAGKDLGDNPIGRPTAWHIGVAANPTAVNLERELRRYEWKVEAGAEFVVTQPVFDVAQLENFVKRIDHMRVPLIVGMLPLTSFKQAEFMTNELPGWQVPEPVLARMRKASERSEQHARAEGLTIARELLARVRALSQGVQVTLPGADCRLAQALLDS